MTEEFSAMQLPSYLDLIQDDDEEVGTIGEDTDDDNFTGLHSSASSELPDDDMKEEKHIASTLEKSCAQSTRDEAFLQYFYGSEGGGSSTSRCQGVALANKENAALLSEASLFGQLLRADGLPMEGDQSVFLNTHEPFCMVAVGVQGGGKSHTLASVLEGCLIPYAEGDVVRLDKPMTSLVLHYDQCATASCEVVHASCTHI